MNHCYFPPEKRYGNRLYDFANSFRNIAMEIDQHPEFIARYYHLPAIEFMLSDRDKTIVERVQYFEALSYGDPGVMLASPGPSLSGLLLQSLGTKEQIDFFYSTIQSEKMQTFFALTEPNKGSDAHHIETTVSKISEDQYLLSGKKAFFGNGAIGKMGVVFARLFSGPLGIRAIFLTPDLLIQSGIQRYALPMFGLRGAQIAAMEFNHYLIPASCVLGQHLSACENGILGIMTVFNRLRSGVGALALGQAQAIYDIFYHETKHLISFSSLHAFLYSKLNVARNMIRLAAKKIDQNPFEATPSSIAKMIATRTAETVISTCLNHFKIQDLLINPLLLKAYRDVFCWEYMEGTSTIQKMIISRDIDKKIQSILSGVIS